MGVPQNNLTYIKSSSELENTENEDHYNISNLMERDLSEEDLCFVTR